MTSPRFNIEDLRPLIDVRFARSSGPGGQNVNKVNTRVTLLFDFANSAVLTPAQRGRIRDRLRTRLSSDGRLRVVSQAERTQPANRARAESRLLELLTDTLKVRKARRPTRPTRASQERRLRAKREHGQKKSQRRARVGRDD